MVLLQGKTISLREGMKLRKTQLSYRLKKMNGNVRKDGKIWNTGVALLKYFAGLNSNQNGQYGAKGVCYIHGSRKNRKAKLILGHSYKKYVPDVSVKMPRFKDGFKRGMVNATFDDG